MAQLYESDRVDRLARIQRSFSSAVRVGDHVVFGLKGDPAFPPEYRSNRPKGKVVRVKGVGTDGASLRVRLDSGSLVDVMPYSLDPRRVWEFSDESFEKVVQRNQPQQESVPVQSHQYPDYGGMVPKSEYDKLLAKVDIISSRLEKEVANNKDFNGAIVASFSEMADEVRRVSTKSTPFCDTFSTEYRNMVDSRGTAKHTRSPFDSDFNSDSDDY